MNEHDAFLLFTYFLGIAVGLWLGWYLWRRPQLKYKTGEQND
jgi:hypothetical protein